jgi:micrococcal nuclease
MRWAMLLLALLALPVHAKPVSRVVTVASVHDGDTFAPTRGAHVRLYGEDAPEVNDPRPEARAMAVQARDHLAALIGSQPVTLTPDGRRWRMSYERVLAYGTLPDGTDLSLRMIADGYAVALPNYRLRPGKVAAYCAAEAEARAASRGLWGQGFTPASTIHGGGCP